MNKRIYLQPRHRKCNVHPGRIPDAKRRQGNEDSCQSLAGSEDNCCLEAEPHADGQGWPSVLTFGNLRNVSTYCREECEVRKVSDCLKAQTFIRIRLAQEGTHCWSPGTEPR